jgi:hypothetical protein
VFFFRKLEKRAFERVSINGKPFCSMLKKVPIREKNPLVAIEKSCGKNTFYKRYAIMLNISSLLKRSFATKSSNPLNPFGSPYIEKRAAMKYPKTHYFLSLTSICSNN